MSLSFVLVFGEKKDNLSVFLPFNDSQVSWKQYSLPILDRKILCMDQTLKEKYQN